jgi:Leucine-rich repeat (LRR) protein
MNNLSSLPDSIGKISSLASLELSDNRLASLPASLGQLSGLASLGLRSNCLAGLPAEVGGLSSLSYLDISMNHITVRVAAALLLLTYVGYVGCERCA